MDVIHKGLIILLRSAILDVPGKLPDGFRLEEAQELIKRQNLSVLAYEGALRCGISRNSPVMLEMFRMYYLQAIRSEKQMAAVEALFAAFDQAKIDYLPLKGTLLKKMYRNPVLRPMGDADILIRVEQYDAIQEQMQKLGYIPYKENDYEFGWKTDDLHVELHRFVIPPKAKDYHTYYKDSWQRAVALNGTRYAYSPEDNFVFIFTHFAKHYRNSGIGARHLADLFVYRKTVADMDESVIRKELEQLNLLEFYEHILRTLHNWFENGASDVYTDLITAFIFSGGVWGKTENRVFSEEMRKANQQGRYRNTRMKRFVRTLFPNLAYMSEKYQILRKIPVFLPVFWIVRWFETLLIRPKNISHRFKDVAIANDDRVLKYREALNFVGLEFDFKE